jgi:hypothetical protein
MGELFQPMHIFFLLIVASVIFPLKVPAYWMIFKKAGFEPALSLLTIIPGVQLVVLYYVALAEGKTGAIHVAPGFTPPVG